MPRELEDHYSDVYPAARNPPCPQQLHYYDERRRPRGAHFGSRFDRSDMGAAYYPHESWSSSGRPYYPRPEFDYGPGSPFIRESYGRSAGPDVYYPHRSEYRRHDTEERGFRSPDGPRDGSMEREHGERKRRHHKSSKHRHRRSRHHRRHKRSKRSAVGSDDEHRDNLPSLTLGAEISRGRRHGASSVTRTSLAGSDISDDGSRSVGEPFDSVEASVTLSPSTSTVPVAYSGYDVENDEGEIADPPASVEDSHQSTEESDASSSDVESISKKSQSSASSSESESRSPAAVKHKTKTEQVMKARSSYATALAAKLRQNRLALEERSCRRPDTSTPRLQPTDGSPSVINNSSVNTETSRLCSDSNLVTDNGLNVERLVTANIQLEALGTSSAVSCSAPVRISSSVPPSASQSTVHCEIPSTPSLNWYVVLLKIVNFDIVDIHQLVFMLLFRVNM